MIFDRQDFINFYVGEDVAILKEIVPYLSEDEWEMSSERKVMEILKEKGYDVNSVVKYWPLQQAISRYQHYIRTKRGGWDD